MATLQFELVAPERVVVSAAVEAVMLPGTEGDMTVLPGHAPTMTTLKAGFIVVTEDANAGSRVFIRGGFAEINGEGVVVLAERAMPFEDLTQETLDKEIADANLARDGSTDNAAREDANALIAQLEETKAALRL